MANRLCQNSEWNKERTNTRHIFLSQLSMALTDSQNQRRSQQSRLKPKKSEIALRSDNQGSDSDSEYDFVGTESVDTSNNEHISEESDLSNFDIEQGDVVTTSQPETLQKDGIIRSMYPKLEESRIAAANIMKKKA
ncbi:unnamed protein product [Rotaria sordida]|uniref:Uncharacterized protein n=2 Tax=Rotaria sordida TaxID=392033 RepID=A0A814UXY3_9BILA|nr:unnamed protein product [Rotaria sordida]